MPTATTSGGELVTLKDGFAISLAALRLAWALEERGCYLRRAADGIGLYVGPRERLTPEDRDAIVCHRAELLALIDYINEQVQ